MARRYAEGTTVSPEKSQAEIQALLRRRGATEYAVGWKQHGAVLGFALDGFRVRLELPFPQEEDVAVGPRQDPADVLEREWKRRWRGLYLVIKAKLELVDTGQTTIEREFLADLVLPSGETVGQAVMPKVLAAYSSGRVPRNLLPEGT